MKCISCQNEVKYKERPDRKCPTCGRAFAFEPKAGDPFPDSVFAAAIDRVSSRGTVHWLPLHLYYELNRYQVKKARIPALGSLYVFLMLLAAGGGLLVIWREAYEGSILVLLFALLITAVCVPQIFRARQATPLFPSSTFWSLWRRWCEVHSSPPGVIQAVPQLPRTRSLPADVTYDGGSDSFG